ncbi:MAG: methionine gamma-lyase family protein [Syntrophomonadaceae bacterium]|nr:methionine gamma-lyase family protein [Syntrophomonadaceae bacterium]
MVHKHRIISQAEEELRTIFAAAEEIAYHNQIKVLDAFRALKIRAEHFHGSSGYGYDDRGRDDLEQLFAKVFGAEEAIVRAQIVSGTHAISACLFGLLRPGDILLSIAGAPYDTLQHVIGNRSMSRGTLCERGVIYKEMPLLTTDQKVDVDRVADYMQPLPRLVLIQRSGGYSLRPAVDMDTMTALIKAVRGCSRDCVIMVDNCYGEFTEPLEPIECGADIIAGSLIKNPGGGLAPGGGYICGRSDLIGEIAAHLTAPGLGKALGASNSTNRQLYQGFFLAPHVTLQAMKSSLLLAWAFAALGYEVFPRWNDKRSDIVQTVILGDADKLLRFVRLVQSYSPVDSDVVPEFAMLPGYDTPVVMAAGTFVQGSSIELSADAPRRDPYGVFWQGGLSYEHSRHVISRLVEEFGGLT